MKRYNILNNSLGWLCFVIAAVTYLLTLEPTASFWDCPEFILQGYKLEVGHPPGNPIFMLAARFFVNFAFGDVTKVAIMVNAMSGLLSAGTILLLFWTITHLVKRLIVDDDATEIPVVKQIVIFASGFCGALMYAWSDTFWFSAVEGEVYAFSSFCTALVFWLILKWENRADRPDSDKYLILIAYVIGISIAVHLLNLLCIPAIVLVIYYRKWTDTNVKGSIIALLISFVIVALILYGLVPGFINVSQTFEMFCVNSLGMSFNMGVLIYAIITVAAFVWTIAAIYRQAKSGLAIRVSFMLSILLSGILCIGGNAWIGALLFIALGVYMFATKRLPLRVLNIVATSILVIFIGYSSYALLLIRSSAHTPMNQNSPDNVFALASYLNREQYGDRPLIYGETFDSPYAKLVEYDSNYNPSLIIEEGAKEYARKLKTDSLEPDSYIETGHKETAKTASELNMLFPRMYSPQHKDSYASWIGLEDGWDKVDAYTAYDELGNPLGDMRSFDKPTFAQSMRYFFVYQLNHMYWRYFMWNFAGRQNDIQGQGEPTHGNWISGIPFIDNPRLGDQSLLPDELGKGNKGHNVFFMLPLIMGLIGLVWQGCTSKRGVEQFWVVFFLFFMTGIAIVLYLNQYPDQPRERDYAFAGSFYAYAIWVGIGVCGLWRGILSLTEKKKAAATATPDKQQKDMTLTAAIIAAVVGIIVPLQVVSQTWDDHDRSGRTAARDFGMNYLNSLDPNAIIFTYGDNDTFPLWYAQEVEGVRTDVKVVNLSYFTTDWYINQLRRQTYEAPGIDLKASPEVYAYNIDPYFSLIGSSDSLTSVSDALDKAYTKELFDYQYYNAPIFPYNKLYIPANAQAALEQGRITAADTARVDDIMLSFRNNGGLGINHVMVMDLLSTNAANGWKRPVYYAITVPNDNYIGLMPYFSQTGMAYEVVPARGGDGGSVNTDKMYRNITERWQWGGLDTKQAADGNLYMDETVRRMVTSNRDVLFTLALSLAYDGLEAQYMMDIDSTGVDAAKKARVDAFVAQCLSRADTILALQEQKMPVAVMPLSILEINDLADAYNALYELSHDEKYQAAGREMLRSNIIRFAHYIRYYHSLKPWQYNLLSNQDKYVMYTFKQLLQYYHDFDGDVEQLGNELMTKYHVDLNRALS